VGLFQLPRATRGIWRSRRRMTLLALSVFTAAYFAATVSLASLKPFSFDELTTYNIARLATSGEVWRAWFESGDGVPPVVHFATHLVGSAVGFSHVTARLPDMVGFWLTCLCIFLFLSRRMSPALAVAGMLLPVTVPLGYSYAFEARGYGMVLAFSGAAVVCWDFARDPRWRRVALLGLPLCLAAAIATHAYAVLVIVPFALAELARTMEHRRVDWWPWLGLAAATLLFLPANPIISHIRRLPELSRYSVRHRVGVSVLLELWPQFLSISATYLGLLALVCLGRDRASTRDGSPSPTSREGPPSPADWVLVLGLAALPLIGWLFANLVTGLLLFRYVIAALIGFSLVIPLLCQIAASDRPKLALLLAGWVAVTAAASVLGSRHAVRTTAFTTAHITAGGGCFRLLTIWERLPEEGLPIVVSDFYVFNQLVHYAPEPLKQRLVFVVDREFGGLIEPYMPYYARVFGQRMEGFDEFLRSQRSFYLYDCGSSGRLPLVARLLEAGASVRDSALVETPDILLRRDLYRVSVTRGSTARHIHR
jgi:hypothetical protein